jgi:hypothetical protein
MKWKEEERRGKVHAFPSEYNGQHTSRLDMWFNVVWEDSRYDTRVQAREIKFDRRSCLDKTMCVVTGDISAVRDARPMTETSSV